MRIVMCMALLLLMGCKENQKDVVATNKQEVPEVMTVGFDHVSNVSEQIFIDGVPSEAAWASAEWRPMDQVWLGKNLQVEDFMGKYKLLWDEKHLYILAEIHDDTLVDTHADPLDRYWDDDCLEIFIDEDASGGNHQYNHNAFAYHIGLDNTVVDIGTDEKPHVYPHAHCKRKMRGKRAHWEVALSIYDDSFVDGHNNKNTPLIKGKEMGFAIAYCDNDHSVEREHFIGSEVVEGTDKNRGWIDADIFGKIKLTSAE